jgi:RNA polymerase sigma factor (sigma-70 family)
MIEDAELLRRYAEGGAEAAFAEFVERRVNFVYACALRRVGGDAHFAKDVTQQVFVSAARDAARLARHPVLTGWLYTTTRNVAAQLVRTERRRQARERLAEAMKNNDDTHLDWEQLRPVLDDALDELGETERQAVLLRYFEGKSYAEVGARLRLGENTARMRVDRALDKLSALLHRRGITSTGAALAIALASQPGVAAPAGLAAAATGAALAGASAGAAGGGLLAFMGMTKLQVGIAGAVIAAGGVGVGIQAREAAALRQEMTASEQQVMASQSIAQENAALQQAVREAEAQASAKAIEIEQVKSQAAAFAAQTQAAPRATPGTPGSTPVYDLKSLDQQPVARLRTQPRYPFVLRSMGAQGEATVDFIVDADGVVQNVSVLKTTHREFGDAAADAVKNWKFKPGIKGNAAVATHMQVPIVFQLNTSKDPDAPSHGSAPWF